MPSDDTPVTDTQQDNTGFPIPWVRVCPYCLEKVPVAQIHDDCAYWDHLDAQPSGGVVSKETGRVVSR